MPIFDGKNKQHMEEFQAMLDKKETPPFPVKSPLPEWPETYTKISTDNRNFFEIIRSKSDITHAELKMLKLRNNIGHEIEISAFMNVDYSFNHNFVKIEDFPGLADMSVSRLMLEEIDNIHRRIYDLFNIPAENTIAPEGLEGIKTCPRCDNAVSKTVFTCTNGLCPYKATKHKF